MVSRLYRGLSSGGPYEGYGDIGSALFDAGLDQAKKENRKRANADYAVYNTEITRQEGIIERLKDENPNEPGKVEEEIEKFSSEWDKSIKEASTFWGSEDEISARYAEQKQSRQISLRDWARDTENANDIINHKVNRKQAGQTVRFDNPEEMKMHLQNLGETELDFVASGVITDEQGHENILGDVRFHLHQYALQNPGKGDDPEYYINNPNKLVTDFKIVGEGQLKKPIFGPEEKVKLKKEHNSNKENAKTQAKIVIENSMADANIQSRQYSMVGKFGLAKEEINKGFNSFDLKNMSAENKNALVDWHTATLNKLQNANSILFSTGVNVYTTTQNPILYDQLRRRTALGEHISDTELASYVGKDGISWTHHDKIKDERDGKSSKAQAFEDTVAGGNLYALIDKNIKEDRDLALNQFAKDRGEMLLIDAIENHPEWTGSDKKMEALRIARNLEKEYDSGALEREMEKVFKPYYGLDIKKLERLDRELTVKKKPKGIPQVTTDSEYDKLPSGAEFIDAETGKRYRKP